MQYKINYNKIKEVIPMVILIGIIFFQTYCNMVSIEHMGIYGDEFFTYGLANNTQDYLFINPDVIEKYSDGTGWISEQVLKDYLTVNKGEAFDYVSVFHNQSKDVHPPFYYILVHTICSFIPEDFVVMSGRLINVLSIILIQIMLYLIGIKLFGERWYALLLNVSVTSAGYIGLLVSYTRMYTLLGFLCLLLTYVNICIVRGECVKKNRFILFATVLIGGLTHYYFYIFLVVQIGIILLYSLMIKGEKIRDLFVSLIPVISGGLLAACIFPRAIYHMLIGYRGDEIIDGLFSSKTDNFMKYINIILQYVFRRWDILIFIFIFYMLFVWMKKKEKKITFEWVMLIGTFLGYFIIISYISIGVIWTYMSPIFLIGTILGTGILVAMFKTSNLGLIQILYILLCVYSCYGICNEQVYNAEVEHARKDENIRLLTEDGIGDCIFVYREWDNLFTNQIPYFLYMDEIYSQDMNTISEVDMAKVISSRNSADNHIILYIHVDSAEEEIVSMVEEEIGQELEFIFRNNKFNVYQ